MKKSVFLVSTGSYSDYQVVAVFSTQEKAEEHYKILSNFSKDVNDIEEMPLDPIAFSEYKEGYKAFEILMRHDYQIKDVYEDLRYTRYVNDCAIGEIYYNNDKSIIYLHLFAKDRDHAIKIAADKVREIVATVGWGNLIE